MTEKKKVYKFFLPGFYFAKLYVPVHFWPKIAIECNYSNSAEFSVIPPSTVR